MSKTRRWVIILLSLLALVLIGVNLVDKDTVAPQTVNSNEPTYKSEHSTTLAYSPEGALNYRLVAEHVEYFSDTAVSWFTNPVMTQYDENKVATWSLRADRAKLTNDRMLYLYGNVVLTALANKGSSQTLKQAILSHPTYIGVQSEIRFDEMGDAKRDTYMTTIHNGQFLRVR